MSEKENKQDKKGLISRLRNYFFTGILVTAPAAITIYLAVIFVNYVDSSVTKFIPKEYNPEAYFPYGIPGIGVIILLILFIIIGMFATGIVGRFFLRLWEKVLVSTPIISSIYNALKQVFETFCSTSSKNSFHEVVMLEYPRKGIWTMAFVTGKPTKEMQDKAKGKELEAIFVPTTPNPTSGFLLFVPREDLIPLDISVEDGLKMIVSVGIVHPSLKEAKNNPSLTKK